VHNWCNGPPIEPVSEADPPMPKAGIALAHVPGMASISYEDTLIVSRRPDIQRPARRLTTQFAPERQRIAPWIVAIALWLAAVAQPINPAASVERELTAQQLLGSR
jgi:hypothetical protein